MTVKIPRLTSAVSLALLVLAAPLGSVQFLTFGSGIALADKGGNGGGNGGGGQSSGGGGAAHASANSNFSSQKSTAKGSNAAPQVQVAKVQGPAEASLLGRWNAAKPYDHPAIQAHIANGNFKGTIGMVANYLVAQKAVDDLQGDPDFAANLTLANATLAAQAAYLLDNTLTPPTAEELAWATGFVAQADGAMDALASAEATMAEFSNRGDWADIRGVVRTRMGLLPDENDLVL